MHLPKKRVLPVLLVFIVAIGLLMTTAFAEGDAPVYLSMFHATALSLLPPVIAIGLALITKEVYSSLFVGILVGALLYSNFNIELAVNTMFFNEEGGMIAKLSGGNMGILIFLVVLGIMVALMNKAGGSAAFGNWASGHIKTRVGAQLTTVLLGCLIFIDDYFNCLTVGSVMRPVTDTHHISRAKLAYIIDATAAPVCIIAPISSWAAAVTSSVPESAGINGFQMFLNTIPYNLYALLTIIMMITLAVTKFDFGPMRGHEDNARDKNDLFTTPERPFGDDSGEIPNAKGRVVDLVLPVVVLIAGCIFGMIYSGGFFDAAGGAHLDFIAAFSASSASVGLVWGSFIALMFTFLFYMLRRVISFKEFTDCIPIGFQQMIPPILILTFAWTLSGMTGLLGGAQFVGDLMANAAGGLRAMLPAAIFLVGVGLSFATGTSWGTFGILIPIVCAVFPTDPQMLTLAIASCLAGSVCGDHCSPISDTTIMASAGAQCLHVNHVSTQLPYAMVAAACSFVGYIFAGFVVNPVLTLLFSIILLEVVLFLLRRSAYKKERALNPNFKPE